MSSIDKNAAFPISNFSNVYASIEISYILVQFSHIFKAILISHNIQRHYSVYGVGFYIKRTSRLVGCNRDHRQQIWSYFPEILSPINNIKVTVKHVNRCKSYGDLIPYLIFQMSCLTTGLQDINPSNSPAGYTCSFQAYMIYIYIYPRPCSAVDRKQTLKGQQSSNSEGITYSLPACPNMHMVLFCLWSYHQFSA